MIQDLSTRASDYIVPSKAINTPDACPRPIFVTAISISHSGPSPNRELDQVRFAAMDSSLYRLRIAASKDMIVSNGRSMRERVGFERSGSAIMLHISSVFFLWLSLGKHSLMMFPFQSLCWMERNEKVLVDVPNWATAASCIVASQTPTVVTDKTSNRVVLTRLCLP